MKSKNWMERFILYLIKKSEESIKRNEKNIKELKQTLKRVRKKNGNR